MTELEQAALLWLLWHHQGGGSTIGQPIRRMLGIGEYEHMTNAQVATAKEFARRLDAERQGEQVLKSVQSLDGKLLARFYDYGYFYKVMRVIDASPVASAAAPMFPPLTKAEENAIDDAVDAAAFPEDFK